MFLIIVTGEPIVYRWYAYFQWQNQYDIFLFIKNKADLNNISQILKRANKPR